MRPFGTGSGLCEYFIGFHEKCFSCAKYGLIAIDSIISNRRYYVVNETSITGLSHSIAPPAPTRCGEKPKHVVCDIVMQVDNSFKKLGIVMDDRMAVEAVMAARQLLRSFKEAHSDWENDKTPIDTVVTWYGLEVATFDPDDQPQGTYGWLEPGENLIWLCRDLPETLRRFTLAHELGHAVLHRSRGEQQQVAEPSPDDPCQDSDVQEAVTGLVEQEQFEEILGTGQVYNPRSQRELAQNVAHLLIHSLRQILASDCLPLFTSDGLHVYFYALTAHFGQWREVGRRGQHVRQWQVAAGLIYGQVKKSYRRRKLVRVTHVMRLGTEVALKVALQGLGFSGRLNTAFIERVNLTVRHGIAALARRTWATVQQAPQLSVHLEWWRAYYHFVRPHTSLRVALVQPRARGGKLLAQRYRHRTPAMAAGRTNRRWTAREVLCYPLPPVPHFTI